MPRRVRSDLEIARDAAGEALARLHAHNMTVAADGRRDSDTDQAQRSLLSVYTDLSRKTRAQRITGRSDIAIDLEDDDD
jgi:hypothetical protein